MSTTAKPTAAQVEQLADLSLFKKLRAGRRLSKAEEARLEELRGSKKKTRKSGEVFDSLKHASAGMNIPLELLTEAKNLGANGFRGSRIYASEVRAWLDSNPMDTPGGDNDSLIGLRKKFLRSQIAKADFQLSILKGEHMPIAEIVQTLTVLISELNTFIRNIESEIPGAILGLSIPDAALVIQKKFDAMRVKINTPLVEYRKAQAELEKKS